MASAELVVATLGDAIARGADLLRAAGSPSARLDAELLAGFVTGIDRTSVLAHPEIELAPEERHALAAALERRAAGEPIAYIRGFKEWHALRIRTDARALIPRPETELLADATIQAVRTRLARSSASVVAWDLGTGSGAIAVAIGLALTGHLRERRLTLVASDISEAALALAGENLADHGLALDVRLVRGDLLEAVAGDASRPDIVVANLPYVPSADVDSGVGSLAHEPRLALDGGSDGLEIVRRLLTDVEDRAAPGATVHLEIGAGQDAAVRDIAPRGSTVEVLADLAGTPRVVRIELDRSAV